MDRMAIAPEASSTWKVLIADDEQSVHDITRMVSKKITLDGLPIQFFSAFSAEEAKAILLTEPDIALILLDVVMEQDNSGLELVRWIREVQKNKCIRIVLRTGHPGSAPENDIIFKYEINDYKDKTELNHTKLNTVMVSALRNYRDLVALESLNRRLAGANEAIAYASMGKTQFLMRLSHELRTPLNGLVLTTGLLKMTPLDVEQLEYAALLEQSVGRMVPLVDEMLDVARLESGFLALEEHPFSIQEALDGLVEKYMFLAKGKGINLHFSFPTDLPATVYGDRRHFEQIITHLLDNGLKYTSDGFVGIEIRMQELNADVLELECTVMDTGVGISEDIRKRIFDPYFKYDQSAVYQNTGLGLGLVIVKRLIELMGGQIWLNTNYDRGTQFVFSLRLQQVKS